MRLILFFLLAGHCVGTKIALAEPIPPHVGEWAFTDYLSYYRSQANFNKAGTSSQSLGSGSSYYEILDQLAVNWDVSPKWRLDASIGYGYAVGTNSISTYTGSMMTELSGGIQYWWRKKSYALVPSFHVGYPFYRINANYNDSLVSEATAWAEPGIWGLAYFRPWAIFGYIAYRYQDGGRAGLMNLNGGLSYRFPAARLRFGVRGEETIVNDVLTNQAGTRNIVLNRVDGGSFKYYSVNPTVFEAYAEGDYIMTREWEAGLGISQTFYGANAAQGWTALAMVRLRMPGDGGSVAAAPANDSYWEAEPSRYDERSFRDSNPTTDPDAPTVLYREPAPKPKRVRKKRKQSVDSMMNETEKSLKSN